MKKLLIAVVTLLVVLLVAPWGVGRMAEARINRDTDEILAVMPYLKVVDRQWTSGWFRSGQVVTYEVTMPGFDSMLRAMAIARAQAGTSELPAAEPAPPKPVRFQVRNEILHGPILGMSGIGLARMNIHPVLSEATREKIKDVFGTDDPVQLSLKPGFIGGGTLVISGDARNIPLAKIDARQTGSISWDDFRLAVGISRHVDAFTIKGRQPRIEFSDGRSGSVFTMSDITVAGDSKRIAGELYDTDMKSGIGKVRYAGAKTPSVEVDKLHYDFETSREGDFLDYEIQLGTGEARSDALKESGLELRKIHYDFSLRHLHVDTMQKLADAMKAAYATPQGNVETAFMQPFRAHGLQLLQHDPELIIDQVGIQTPQGNATVKGSIKLEGVNEQDLDGGMAAITQRLLASFTVEIAQSLIEKFPNGATMAGSMLDQGFAKREGDKLVSRIEFRKGQLTINGKLQNVPLPGVATPAPPDTRTPGGNVL